MHRGIGIMAFLVGTTLLAAEPAKIPLSEDIDPVLLGRWLEKAFDGKQPPEAARMLISIAKGSQMGPGDGWFGPCQSRYNWAWLAKQQGIKDTDSIAKDKFKGPAALFARLDRNKNGEIGSDDLDWSDASPYLQQSAMINRVFRRLNKAGDGQLTREEWLKFFEEASKGKEALSPADLRDALLAGMSGGNRMAPGDAPTPQQLVRGLFRGEIGSMNEGPRVNEPAPDFSLKTRDGKETIRLSDQLGKKPIVLVFGNFTCGPFRSIYPQVDDPGPSATRTTRLSLRFTFARPIRPMAGGWLRTTWSAWPWANPRPTRSASNWPSAVAPS